VARCALADQEDGAPFCDRVREANSHGEAMVVHRQERNIEGRRKKRGQRPSLALRTRARACWGAHLREGDVPARTRV
jgi:hypothetical protein